MPIESSCLKVMAVVVKAPHWVRPKEVPLVTACSCEVPKGLRSPGSHPISVCESSQAHLLSSRAVHHYQTTTAAILRHKLYRHWLNRAPLCKGVHVLACKSMMNAHFEYCIHPLFFHLPKSWIKLPKNATSGQQAANGEKKKSKVPAGCTAQCWNTLPPSAVNAKRLQGFKGSWGKFR